MDIKLAHDAAEYIGTLSWVSFSLAKVDFRIVHQQNSNDISLEQRFAVVLSIL
jgi:hypothetical protein